MSANYKGRLLGLSLVIATTHLLSSIQYATANSIMPYNPDPCSVTNQQLDNAGFVATNKVAMSTSDLVTTENQKAVLTHEGEKQFRENFPAVITLYGTGITYGELTAKICYWGPSNKHIKLQSMIWKYPEGPAKFDIYLRRMPSQFSEQLIDNFGLNTHAKQLVDSALSIKHSVINANDISLLEFDGGKVTGEAANVFSCWAGIRPGLEIFATGFKCDNVQKLLSEILSTNPTYKP